MELKGKRIIVTGCSSGIGEACAQIICENGGFVIGICRDAKKANLLKSPLRNSIKILEGDLTKIHEISNLLTGVEEKIDGFVHAAGVDCLIPLQFAEAEQYREAMDINFGAFAFLCKEITKSRFKSQTQSIICISSIASIKARPGASFYSATKGAVDAFTKSLSIELASRGVRVNTICPGLVNTRLFQQFFSSLREEQRQKILDQHPFGVGDPSDVAELCLFLLSQRSKWMTGVNIVLDGGYSIN
jgi:NAD(P)-dependent dehydrogenase (short-subunit alcohol dehydrogenase family)